MRSNLKKAKYYGQVDGVIAVNRGERYTAEEIYAISTIDDNRFLANYFGRTVDGIETMRKLMTRADRNGTPIIVVDDATFEMPKVKTPKRRGYISETEAQAQMDAGEA